MLLSLTRRRLLFAGAAACGAAALPGAMRRGHRGFVSLFATQPAMTDSPATIALGDPRNFDLNAPGTGIDRQPVGMHFYERDWPVDELGSVRYLQGARSFDIPRVTWVMGSSNPERPAQGIYAWHVSSFAMNGPKVAHALARDRLFALFEDILRAGWRRYLPRSDARLRGAEALRYFLQQGGRYPLDPAYPLNLDQWMKVNENLPYWQFWADGVYMDVEVTDEPALRNPERPGVYMFSITLESEPPHFWKYFRKVEDMHRWTELIPAELAKLSPLRSRAEAELRSQGYVIDETYRDPPILGLGESA